MGLNICKNLDIKKVCFDLKVFCFYRSYIILLSYICAIETLEVYPQNIYKTLTNS